MIERFSTEYLTELRESGKHCKDNTTEIKVGDVVIINQRNMPRNSWPLGKVVRLVKSSDERARGAVFLSSRGIQLNRLLYLLYPLELYSEISADQKSMEEKLINPKDPLGPSVKRVSDNRPKRITAITGELKRRIIEC